MGFSSWMLNFKRGKPSNSGKIIYIVFDFYINEHYISPQLCTRKHHVPFGVHLAAVSLKVQVYGYNEWFAQKQVAGWLRKGDVWRHRWKDGEGLKEVEGPGYFYLCESHIGCCWLIYWWLVALNQPRYDGARVREKRAVAGNRSNMLWWAAMLGKLHLHKSPPSSTSLSRRSFWAWEITTTASGTSSS